MVRQQCLHKYIMMRRNSKKGPSYLDVAEFILTGPFSPKITPALFPVEAQAAQVQHFNNLLLALYPHIAISKLFTSLSLLPQVQNLTPLSRPLYIEIEGGEPSPYLKQLLSKVGNSEIQFMDFTLEGPGANSEEEQWAQEEELNEEMSVIQEQENPSVERQQPQKTGKYEYNPEQYIPNMHLLELGPQTLKLEYFKDALKSLKNASQQEKKEFILLYLTDADLQTYKDEQIDVLTDVAIHNLQNCGIVTRLERNAMVARYLQKKKRRIWKKKINYDCRKKVADNRLRFKGKFVTTQQACQMLGIQLCSQQVLKDILKSSDLHKMMF